jgi:isopentenyl-diphosphate delta-isomerase
MSENLSDRKADHLALCATDAVAFKAKGPLFGDVRLVHDALPDLAVEDVSLACTVLGKTLRAPILIAAMTGGTERAARVNHELARIAEERGYAFGVGSQRAMHVRKESASTYRVRDVAPKTLVLGNIGVVQARAMSTAEVRELAEEIGADAVCIHMNPAMELVQPGGDRDFRGGLATIERLAKELDRAIVAKETGCGISRSVGARLRGVGVRHVDVSGAGGTSWVGVETKRAEAAGDQKARSLGELYWDWGVPTAASVAMLAPQGFDTLIATGGVANGLDIAKAIALGAHLVGIARGALMALESGGRDGALAFFDSLERELLTAMLLTGSKDLAALRAAPRLVGGELALWMERG